MLRSIFVSEGWRFFKRRLDVGLRGLTRIPGNAHTICETIVKQCFNGTFFQVSKHNHQAFYCRDVGWCTPALLRLGYREELHQSVAWALERFAKHGHITVAISQKGTPFNFPDRYSVDSVSFLFFVLAQLEAKSLVEEHRTFLEKEIKHFMATAIEPDTGLVRSDHFSSMRDHAVRQSCCYDNCMAGLMQQSLSRLGLPNPLKTYAYKKTIQKQYWNGSFFYDDQAKHGEVVGDANLFPFWTGLFSETSLLRKMIRTLQHHHMDEPFPLTYTGKKNTNERFIPYEALVPNWEGTTVWTQLGMIYLELLARVDRYKAQQQFAQYTQFIEQYGTFLEIVRKDGQPYRSPWYYSDEGMLWAAMYLDLEKTLSG